VKLEYSFNKNSTAMKENGPFDVERGHTYIRTIRQEFQAKIIRKEIEKKIISQEVKNIRVLSGEAILASAGKNFNYSICKKILG